MIGLERMDRAWIKMDRRSPEYEVGVDMFLDFVSRHASDPNQIRCPCLDCGNVKPGTIRTIKDHLFCIGIINTYDVWYYHGEDVPSSSSTNVKSSNYKEDHFRDNTVEMVQAAHELVIQKSLSSYLLMLRNQSTLVV